MAAVYHYELQEINRSLVRIAVALEKMNKDEKPVVVNVVIEKLPDARSLITQAKLAR